MEPSPSAEPNLSRAAEPLLPAALAETEITVLFSLADGALRAGLAGRGYPRVDVTTLPPPLRERRGVFVTVDVAGELNGCVGSIEGEEPLGVAVGRLAWQAAFADPRLPPLEPRHYPDTTIKLSLLGDLVPLAVSCEAEVLAALRPGLDGLLIDDGTHRATFLPAVWAQLADPAVFLRELERKAGSVPVSWPVSMQAWRYRTTEIARRVGQG